MSAKTYVLDLQPDTEQRLLGVVTTESMVRFTWELNRLLDIDLQRSSDLVIEEPKSKMFFPRCLFTDPETEVSIALLRNKGVHGTLLPKLRQMDYLIVEEKGYAGYLTSAETLNRSRLIGIQFCSEIKTENEMLHQLQIFDI